MKELNVNDIIDRLVCLAIELGEEDPVKEIEEACKRIKKEIKAQ